MANTTEKTAVVVPFGPANGTEREFIFGAWIAFSHAPTFYARVVVKITRDYLGRLGLKINHHPEDPAKVRTRVKDLLDGTNIRFFPVCPQKPGDITMTATLAEVLAKWYFTFNGIDRTTFEFMMLDIAAAIRS